MADRLVLNSALEKVLGAGERETDVPIECDGLEHQKEQENMEISFNLEKNTHSKAKFKLKIRS